jgi:hypothetical protein
MSSITVMKINISAARWRGDAEVVEESMGGSEAGKRAR